MFKVTVECHKCKTQVDPSEMDDRDWYHPFHVYQEDGTLQTQLCPKCAPRSLKRLILRRDNHLPRWVHWLYAFWHGYYWLPCLKCGRKYGGHENGSGAIYTGNGSGYSLCPQCGGKQRAGILPALGLPPPSPSPGRHS